METAILIYLYLAAGSFIKPFCVIGSVGSIAWVFIITISGFVSSFGDPDTDEPGFAAVYNALIKYKKHVLGVIIASLVLSAAYPSKEDIAWIVGGSVAVGVASSEEAQKLPDNVLRATNQFLEGIAESEEKTE